MNPNIMRISVEMGVALAAALEIVLKNHIKTALDSLLSREDDVRHP
jgi:hypothetical protein